MFDFHAVALAVQAAAVVQTFGFRLGHTD